MKYHVQKLWKPNPTIDPADIHMSAKSIKELKIWQLYD